jgi:hypothetical protein
VASFVYAFPFVRRVNSQAMLKLRGSVENRKWLVRERGNRFKFSAYHLLKVFCSPIGEPSAEEFMFCDRCGAAVQPGQGFCSKCGKQIVGPISLVQPRPGRVQEHVRLLGLFWLALSAFNTIASIILYVIANTFLLIWARWERPKRQLLSSDLC